MMKVFSFLVVSLIFLTENYRVAGKICMATNENEFLCTDDPSKARASKGENLSQTGIDPAKNPDYGVVQTVEGNKSVRMATTEVLERMEDYFKTEVMAKPEYAE